jgi:hypothetical protein
MLDVHPPEHAAHSWRDFFTHIITIVIGLLIAVGLEQAVEYVHHRHEVTETRERITVELRFNRSAVENNVSQLRHDEAQWEKYSIALSQPNMTEASAEQLQYSWALGLELDSAWDVAKQSTVFSYMPPAENEEYTYLYRLFGENYATSVLYIADVRSADAIVSRVRATHTISNDDRLRLLALTDSLKARAQNQLDLYAYIDNTLKKWLDLHKQLTFAE